MTADLARSVDLAMARSAQLKAQRAAAAVVLAKYGACPPVAVWARRVARSDEVGHYSLLFRVVGDPNRDAAGGQGRVGFPETGAV
jgi:hypothetical protein